jgi:hypothetical protein
MINLCLYRSVREAYVHRDEQVECTFAELVDFFKEQQQLLTVKESGLLFNCCRYRTDYESPEWVRAGVDPRDYIRRCKANVESISCLLLDVDGTVTLDQAVARWCDWEFLVYSTHGHTAEKEKFRLVIPVARPLTRDEFDARHTAMIETFGVDGASFTISQAFYLPSYGLHNQDQAFIHWNQTDSRYDALELPAEQIQRGELLEEPVQGQRTAVATSIYRTLVTGSNLHYTDALTLAVLCKAHGLTQEEFIYIVQTIAAADSTLRTADVDLVRLYQQGYNSYITNRKTQQLMQRLNCDMWRWQLSQV